MRPIGILIALVTALCVVVGLVWLTPPTGAGHSLKHPSHPKTMEVGQPGGDSDHRLLVLGAAWGALAVLIYVTLLAMGAHRRDNSSAKRWAFLAGGVGYVAVVIILILLYGDFLVERPTLFIGPLPAPTAWVILGVYLAPFYFVILYSVLFPRWIATAEDLEEFQRLVAERRRRKEEPFSPREEGPF